MALASSTFFPTLPRKCHWAWGSPACANASVCCMDSLISSAPRALVPPFELCFRSRPRRFNMMTKLAPKENAGPKPYRILVADDHAIVRRGIRALLETEPGIEIRQSSPETNVLILTMHFSEDVAREALRSGAHGYVLKSDADMELLSAVRQVQKNRPFFTSKLAISMVDTFIQNPAE